MSKEHGGGHLPTGFSRIPLEWHEDEATAVAVVHFDWDSQDSIEDHAREALAGGTFQGFIEALRLHERQQSQADILIQIVGFADKFSSRAKGLDLLIDCCGVGAIEGRSGSDYAKSWGISKQAWQQERERMRKLLNLPITRTMRGQAERSHMKLRNYRRA